MGSEARNDRSAVGTPAVRLEPFGEEGFDRLLAAVPDARFLLQWAGPEYRYPLDPEQLRRTVAQGQGRWPSLAAYRVVHDATGETVGHVQLMGIDRFRAACVLGRVLIFPEYRGRGLGRVLVKAALLEAFAARGVDEVTLHVFAFNEAAIATYTSLGFSRLAPDPPPHRLADETWPVLRMRLTKERWQRLQA